MGSGNLNLFGKVLQGFVFGKVFDKIGFDNKNDLKVREMI